MSFLDDLMEKAAKKAQDGLSDGKWFDSLMEKAKKGVPVDKPTDDPSTKASRAATLQALETLEKHKEGVKHLSLEGLTSIMASLSLGRLDDATRVYLARGASLDELLAASAASNEEVMRRAQERKKTKDEAVALLKDIGAITARYVLPALLAAL